MPNLKSATKVVLFFELCKFICIFCFMARGVGGLPPSLALSLRSYRSFSRPPRF